MMNMVFLNEFVEILFYLSVTLIIELLVLLGLGYFNKSFIKVLLLINVITNPLYSTMLAIYSHLFDKEMGIILVLILELIIIGIEFKVLFYYLKKQYSKTEILISVFLINGFSFLIVEFIRYVFVHFPLFPLF